MQSQYWISKIITSPLSDFIDMSYWLTGKIDPTGVQSSSTKGITAVPSFMSLRQEPLESVSLPTKPKSLEEFDLES